MGRIRRALRNLITLPSSKQHRHQFPDYGVHIEDGAWTYQYDAYTRRYFVYYGTAFPEVVAEYKTLDEACAGHPVFAANRAQFRKWAN